MLDIQVPEWNLVSKRKREPKKPKLDKDTEKVEDTSDEAYMNRYSFPLTRRHRIRETEEKAFRVHTPLQH